MFDRFLRALALGAGVVLLGLLALVIFDVVMRYVLRLPFLGAYEMTELAMVLIVFLALPIARHRRPRGGGRARACARPAGFRWLTVLAHLAGAALMAVIAGRRCATRSAPPRAARRPTC